MLHFKYKISINYCFVPLGAVIIAYPSCYFSLWAFLTKTFSDLAQVSQGRILRFEPDKKNFFRHKEL